MGAIEIWNSSSADWLISEQQLQKADLRVDADDLSVLCHFRSSKSIYKEERR